MEEIHWQNYPGLPSHFLIDKVTSDSSAVTCPVCQEYLRKHNGSNAGQSS